MVAVCGRNRVRAGRLSGLGGVAGVAVFVADFVAENVFSRSGFAAPAGFHAAELKAKFGPAPELLRFDLRRLACCRPVPVAATPSR